jgi:hypothetical protein
MKNKNYLTRFLIMCLVCILAVANMPLAYAAAPAPAPAGTEVVPTGVDTTKPHLTIKASVSDAVYTGNEFSINYDVFAKATPAGDTSGLNELQNALFIVPEFSRNEDKDPTTGAYLPENQKNSRFTRAVLKETVNQIYTYKKDHGLANFQVGFMKMGASTVLQTFKTVSIANAEDEGGYLNDVIVYSQMDPINHKILTYKVKYNQTTDSARPAVETTAVDGITRIYTYEIFKTCSLDNDMANGINYLNIIQQSHQNPTQWSINDNINIDIATLFTSESNVVTNDYANTMNTLAPTVATGATQVYCVLDGYSADRFVSSGMHHAAIDSVQPGSRFQMDPNVWKDTDPNTADTIPQKIIDAGTNVWGNDLNGVSRSFKYRTTVTANCYSGTTTQDSMHLSLTTDNLDVNKIKPVCLYVNKRGTGDSNKYDMQINYDSNLTSHWSGGSVSYSDTTEKTFTPCPCDEDATGITVDEGSIKKMIGISSNELTNVRLEQNIPEKAIVTDTATPAANGWMKLKTDGTEDGTAANAKDNVNIRKHVADSVDVTTTHPGLLAQCDLKLKVKKSKRYSFAGSLIYNDTAGTERTANFRLEFDIASGVRVYYDDKKEIIAKKGTQKAVCLDVYTGTQKIFNMQITLKAINTTNSANTLSLTKKSAKIVGDAANVTLTQSTVDASTYYYIKPPATTTFDPNTPKRIIIIYNIGSSYGKFDKGNLEIVNIQFDVQDCDRDTVEPVVDKDKAVTIYNKVNLK